MSIIHIDDYKNRRANKSSREYLEMNISEFGLSRSAFNALKRASCVTVRDLYMIIINSKYGLMSVRGLVLISEREILKKMEELNHLIQCASLKEKVCDSGFIMNMPIEELEMSSKSNNCLKRVGIYTLEDLLDGMLIGPELMYNIPNMRGKQAIEEVVSKVMVISPAIYDVFLKLCD